MKSFEKFLFFYGIIAITALFISFGVFSPRPVNFISIVLLFPLLFYFWIRLTNSEKLPVEAWSVRFLFSIVIIALLFILSYWLSLKFVSIPTSIQPINYSSNQPAPSPKTATVSGVIDFLLPDTPPPSLTIKVSGNQPVNVYKAKDISSAVIGTLIPGNAYPYTDFDGSWYKVFLDNSTFGWVEANLVQ